MLSPSSVLFQTKIGLHFRSINQLCQVHPNINKLTKYFNLQAMDKLEFLKGNLSLGGPDDLL